jgi:hypothetical protein
MYPFPYYFCQDTTSVIFTIHRALWHICANNRGVSFPDRQIHEEIALENDFLYLRRHISSIQKTKSPNRKNRCPIEESGYCVIFEVPNNFDITFSAFLEVGISPFASAPCLHACMIE